MKTNTTPHLPDSRNRRGRIGALRLALVAVALTGAACGSTEPGQPTQATATTSDRSTDSSAAVSNTAPGAKPKSTETTVAPSSTTSAPKETITSKKPSAVEQAVAAAQQLPLRRQLALLMFIGFNTGFKDTPGSTDPAAAQQVIDEGVGGVFIGRKELALFNSPVFSRSKGGKLELLVATDAEGGRVDPLPQVGEPLPPASDMAQWPTEQVRTEAAGHGADLRAHGVNVNFAPMLDLEGEPNPLGDRTWSSDPAEVIRGAGAFSEGMCDAGVYPTFKHFPGHGHSDFDADLQPARTPDLATLEGADLIPFRELTGSMKGRSMVMSGHLDVPGLTSDDLPFSLDPEAMAFLRNDVGFDGVVVTDELAEMGSITQRGISVPDAVERSIAAGNDMALFFGGPADLNTVLNQLEEAVAAGRLPKDRIEESVRRVVTLMSSGACTPS